jgi:hypothetical protein
MSLSVICPSCGQRQQLPDDFDRRKVRCPECGVMCPVPEATAPAKKPVAKTESDEDIAARLLGEVESAPQPVRRQPAIPPAPKKSAAPAPPLPPPPEPISDEEDEDDGKAYVVEGGKERKCPQCSKVIEADAVVCVACGLDMRKGKKLKRTYAPIERSWDLGLQMAQRKLMFIALSLLVLVLGLIFGVLAENWVTSLTGWAIFTALLSFMLGTYFHVELTRDKRGRVRLTRTWRICFIRLVPTEIDVREFAGVRAGLAHEGGFFEWLIVFNLLVPFIIPGLLFWYQVIRLDRHYVVLTREHGRADEILYRGNDGELAREVTAALRDAGQLREETV